MWIISLKYASVCCEQLMGTIYYSSQKLRNDRISLGVSSGQFSNESETQIWPRMAWRCVFFVLTIFFKTRFPSLIRTIECSNFTYTLLQSFSLKFISVVGVWSRSKGSLRRFSFSCFGASRPRPFHNGVLSKLASPKYFILNTYLTLDFYICYRVKHVHN